MSPKEQLRFLSLLGEWLTITGRDTYKPQTEELLCPARLRAINEIQHVIFGHLSALASDDSHRYPDDVLMAIILEHVQDRVLKKQVQRAFERAAQFIEKNPA
jgi:hypothetical protein